ncbi:MAG: hypothetical protein V1778_03000 [bacterium]
MNPNTPLQLLRRYRWFFLLFIVVATMATLFISIRARPIYTTSLSITVDRIHRQATSQYQYDGYYAIQADDLFSQTLLSWFLTPSALLEFYQHASVDPHITSLNGLVSRFRARKYSAQNIVVQFSDPDRKAAEKLAAAISTVVKERGESLNQDSEGQGIFQVQPATPVIVQTRTNVPLNTTVAFLASALLAYILVAMRQYFLGETDAGRG